MKNLTQAYLKECFTYNEKTGEFSWSSRPRKHFVNDRVFKIWNTRFSGKPPSDKTCSGGYKRLALNGNNYRLHQLAWLYFHGVIPNVIDHINGVRTDNRIENLRDCDQLTNMKNTKRMSTNTSGFVGVVWEKRRKHWIANIEANKEKIHLGSFKNKEEAILARKNAEVKYGFHENHGRG